MERAGAAVFDRARRRWRAITRPQPWHRLPRELRAGYEMLGRTGAGFIILIIAINIPGLWNIFSTVLFGVRDFLLSNLIFF